MLSIVALFALNQGQIPQWQEPPGTESALIRIAVDQVERDLQSNKGVSFVLSNPSFDDCRPYPRFRELIKKNASVGPIQMTAKSEPGEPLELTVKLGKSSQLVYIYQTDMRGAYGKNGVHIRSNGGDHKFARLFAYGRTNAGGDLIFKTIRPAGYPGGELPQHFHFFVEPERAAVDEIWFDDDPRLTARFRNGSTGHAIIVKPQKADGTWKMTAIIPMR